MRGVVERLLAKAKTGVDVSGYQQAKSEVTFVKAPAPENSGNRIKTPNPSQSGLELYKEGCMYIPVVGGLISRVNQWRGRK